MNRQIQIKSGDITLLAELNNTKTTDAIWQALPLSGIAQIWGEEVYFSVPLSLELENGRELVSKGDLGYWPPGQSVCIFFGPTPVSQGKEIRAASPVNVFGKLIDNPTEFRKVNEGDRITIEKVSN